MNINKMAKVFGIILLVVGILGFVPGVTSTDGLLLGVFHVDTLHNIIHLLTGIIGLVLAKKGESGARTFFKIFGIVYLVVALLGLVQGDTVLGLIGINMADNLLHIVIAALALWYGFKGPRNMAMPSAPQM
jgi:hypothetical protein